MSDNHNLFALITGRIDDPDAPLIRESAQGAFSYGDMLARSARLAHELRAQGVAPGDRVAAQLEKSVDALFLTLACLRVGAVFLPLNPAYRAAELEYFLRDAEPALMVCPDAGEADLQALCVACGVRRLMGLDALVAASKRHAADFEDHVCGPDDLAAILYTSGTTGRAKGAMLSHENLSSNARTLADLWRFTKDDTLIHALPIFHTHGLFVACNVTLLSGASLIFHESFSAARIIEALPRASAMMGVPTFYSRLLADEAFTREAAGHMRVFISGSAPLSPETHKEFQARTGHAILERYGMSETGMNASNPYEGERRPGSVGFALPGIDIRVTDPEGPPAPLPQGEVGSIEIKGPNLFKGYWRMPEKTASEFRSDGFFISGDLGRFDADGYLHIVGRSKDLIISGGFNVYPAEVENALDALPGVAESAVIGAPHPDFGEGVTAVIAPGPQGAPDAAQIRAMLGDVLAKYKVPKQVIMVDALPRNKMGKVQKNELRAAYKDIYASSSP